MKFGIHEVNSTEELREIRSSVLGRSDFFVEEKCLVPDESDKMGINLGHYHDGVLLSTFRGLPVNDPIELEMNLDYPQTIDLPLSYPGIVFGKACTRPEARGRGKIKEIFSEMVERAIQKKMNFIALTTKPSNPLNSFLIEQGFESFENPNGWHRFGYNSLGPTLVFIKRLDH